MISEIRKAAYRLKGRITGTIGHPIPRKSTDKTDVRHPLKSRVSWEQDRVLGYSRDLVWYTDGSKTNESASAAVYGLRPALKHSFPSRQYATVFQDEMDNMKRGLNKTRIHIFTDRHAAITALAFTNIRSSLVWER